MLFSLHSLATCSHHGHASPALHPDTTWGPSWASLERPGSWRRHLAAHQALGEAHQLLQLRAHALRVASAMLDNNAKVGR